MKTMNFNKMIGAVASMLVAGGAVALPVDRIGVKSISSTNQSKIFYNVRTGLEFVPKGYNYGIVQTNGTGNCLNRWVTFDSNAAGGYRYDPLAAQTFFNQMVYDNTYAAAKNTVVRAFIDVGDECRDLKGQYGSALITTTTATLNDAYITNVVDFLLKAKAAGMYAILVLDYVPRGSYYQTMLNANAATDKIEGQNRYTLTSGGQDAKAQYISKFIEAIKRKSADALSVVFAYELQNEVQVHLDKKPFTLSGNDRFVTMPNGLQYDMTVTGISASNGRQQAIDASLVTWVNKSVSAAKLQDPSALVSVSATTYQAAGFSGANGGDETYRFDPSSGTRDTGHHTYPGRLGSLHLWSNASFTSVHLYPTNYMLTPGATQATAGYTASADLASSDARYLDLTMRPFIVGEFGAYKYKYGCTDSGAAVAAEAMYSLRQEVKSYGARGSLFWTWNSRKPGVSCTEDWWNGSDVGGAINGALARPY